MRQATRLFLIDTNGRGLVEFTQDVVEWLRRERLSTGLLTLFCRHTSASLLITENASPEVLTDQEAAFERLAPEAPGLYDHADEGPDDMPAHIRAALTAASQSIPIIGGELALGTWQGIYLFEHRRRGRRREVAAHVMGE
jgi:secondary thiamine-phosphate synthase enzyme